MIGRGSGLLSLPLLSLAIENFIISCVLFLPPPHLLSSILVANPAVESSKRAVVINQNNTPQKKNVERPSGNIRDITSNTRVKSDRVIQPAIELAELQRIRISLSVDANGAIIQNLKPMPVLQIPKSNLRNACKNITRSSSCSVRLPVVENDDPSSLVISSARIRTQNVLDLYRLHSDLPPNMLAESRARSHAI